MSKIENDNKQKGLGKNFISNFLKIFSSKEDNNPKRQALKITYIYFFIGSLWILLSDKLVGLLIKDPETIVLIGIVKGWIYVFITSITIFLLTFNEMKEVVDSKEKI